MSKRSLLHFSVRMNLVLAAGLMACHGAARAETAPAPWYALPTITFEPGPTPNGVLIFTGPLSTTNLGATAAFNVSRLFSKQSTPTWDNTIAGVAYDRDFIGIGRGWFLGGEIGVADRYGTYEACCGAWTVRSDSILNSFEFWGGVQVRYAGFLLFDTVRVGGSLTWGLSTITDSIGSEHGRQLSSTVGADPTLLYLLAPELQLSTPSLPNLELVIRVQHRSGCKSYQWLLPTLGQMREGYNADVIGLRYRF